MTAVLQDDKVEVYRRIVAAAVLAPSAENTQPWRFVKDDDSITVCLDTTRTLASDVDHMLSLTAIGACIENAVIAATAIGLQSDVDYLVDATPIGGKSALLPIAQLRLRDGALRDPLADCIETRCTSRRMDGRIVDEERLRKLQESCKGFSDIEVHWVDRHRLREFSKLIGTGNRIRFEHEPFHRELYDNLRFTPDDAGRTRDGLDVATLQLPAGVASILSALRSWPRMKWANFFGFSRGVARQAAQEVRCSGAVGFLSISGPGTEQFLDGGRALERIWLTAAHLGLCFHPVASLPVFLAHMREGGRRLLPRHQRLARQMRERFYKLFPAMSGRTIQMAFRIGYGPRPPVRSLRRAANTVLNLN